MRKRGIKFLPTVLIVCAAVLCGGIITVSNITANAGLEPSRAYETKFDDGPISGGAWEYSGASVVTDDGGKVGLRVEKAGEGAGIMTNRDIAADSVLLETSIEYLNLNGGWLGFIVGLNKTDAPILDWNYLGSGKYILLQNVGGKWYLITQVQGKGYNLVNGNGEPIKNDGEDEASQRYNKLPDLGSSDTLENIILSLSLDKEGNLVFSMRNAGESADSAVVLAKTAGTKYEPYTAGRVGFCVMQGSKPVDAKFGDVKVFAGGKSDPEAKFRFESGNVSSDYILDVGNNPNSLSFALKGKLLLTSTADKDAYAVCKTPVYFDENVKGYSVKNIDASLKLYKQSGFDGNDEFRVYFGLANPYDTEIAADGTFALKVGAGAFSVVKFDGGTEKTVIGSTAYTDGGEYTDVNLAVDGDGTLTAKVGETAATSAEKQELVRRRTYLALVLKGDATIKADDFTVLNALYSRPNNKNLTANFDNNDINVNEWYLPAWGGNIEGRYDGVYAENNELRFKDVNSNASITTIPQFSNFELKFDITDIKREGYKGSPFIGVMYGLESYKTGFNVAYIADKRPFISFRPSDGGTNCSVLNTENEMNKKLPSKYNMFSPAMKGKVFSVKLTMTDGLLTLCLKRNDESEYTEIVRIQESGSITGCIRINGYGDGVDGECSNFSIDNLSVKNTDVNPSDNNDYGYKSNKDWVTWGGFEYNDTWSKDDLLPVDKSTNQKGCSQSLGVSGGISAVILICLAAALTVRRRRNEK